ncbi:LysM peptidoglycan-binding domain-containing protein [Erwinia sp. CPCC 100877]|nr:LysM peptidoglycan-binding domain-containing protein [Erwinia sp. CPCC 100877]
MKKRNLNSKKLRLLSVGLLSSSAVLSVTDVQPIIAKEADDRVIADSDEQEQVAILSSTKEQEGTESTVNELESSTSTKESSTTTTSITHTQDTTKSVDSTDETTSSTTDNTTDSTNSSTTETTETKDTTSSSSSSTGTAGTETSSTTSSSTTSTTSSSTSTTSTSSTSTKPSKPKPKPKPKPVPKPQPKPVQQPQPPAYGPVQQPAPAVVQPVQLSNNNTITGSTAGASAAGSDEVFHISPNLTTKSFIKIIGEDARTIAGKNNLYASVMIAQAILESASGNSALASAPNYNLFGIKGDYKGASASFLTSEDNGSGSMYTIRSAFRKYPSYKESLGDYVKLLRGGTDFSNSFYKGTWKSNTTSYRDATKFLTGRYATDTSYASKLNGLIEAYNLTQYDTLKADKKAKKVTLNTVFDKLEKQDEQTDQKVEFFTHVVKKGETLKSISELYDLSTLAILEKNQLDRRTLYIGQRLSIPKQKEKITVVAKEEAVDRSLNMVQKMSAAFSDKLTVSKDSEKNTKASSVKAAKESKANTKTEAKNYGVTATRKKTKQTYEVKKGDTLASISKKTGVSVWSLKEWNDLDQYFLTEGQLLVLVPNYELPS